MKKVILLVVVFATVLTAFTGIKKEKTTVNDAVAIENSVAVNNVNLEASVLTWKGSKPTGSHNGTVALQSGDLVVENGTLTQGVFVVDMNTITNTDMAGSDGAAKIEGHLKAADFFDVAQYPTSKFVITSVVEEEGKLLVTGNLTIKAITKSITIPASLSTEDGISTFKSDVFTIDRTDFNVKYGSKSFFDGLKDKFINDLVEMSFEVVTKA
ncbi:YceI family protein [Polaribacter sp. HL-MS24]|uniref:YceI family protein n=1 Tax=Polaribacter sp. HL-MS24 TaxID=3077735 RepID=UPI002934BCAA|nr:YceI family protein [Polaribacter sp. HL-MS24]WOC39558.1 YceI family protein [Polaribacter sp. HL-MS24]